jgi:uncharacterized caspase-like protein
MEAVWFGEWLSTHFLLKRWVFLFGRSFPGERNEGGSDFEGHKPQNNFIAQGDFSVQKKSLITPATSLSSITLFFLLTGCAGTPVIKMPESFPHIVREYRSFKIPPSTDEKKTGLRLREGDFFTIMASGEIAREAGRGRFGPEGIIMWKLGERGDYYLFDSRVEFNSQRAQGNGEMILLCMPYDSSRSYSGSFEVDIILWRKEDPTQISEFFENLSQADPMNATLRKYAESFKKQEQNLLAEQKKAWIEEEATKESILASAGAKEKTVESQMETAEGRKETRPAEKRQEGDDFKTLKVAPIIVIATPKDGLHLDSEIVSLYGVVEHVRKITRLEILVNNVLTKRVDKRSLNLKPQQDNRIDFSERIILKEGKNQITVVAQDEYGIVAKKSIRVNWTKKKGEIWAVIIGINKFKKFPHLKYSVNDAREFHRYMTEVNRVPKENVWLLLDEEATLENLRSVLGTQVRRKAGRDDMVVIYLAGHGTTERDAASLDGDGLEKYILPYNADPTDLYASALPMREIAQIFRRIVSERLVFISDTCYSGASGGRTVPVPGVRAPLSGAFLDRLSQGKGRMILAASDTNEVSVEKDDLGHGVFTYYLLEALRGKGDLDGNGFITLDEVYRYVSEKVPQATEQGQHPVKKGEMVGEIVLGEVK